MLSVNRVDVIHCFICVLLFPMVTVWHNRIGHIRRLLRFHMNLYFCVSRINCMVKDVKHFNHPSQLLWFPVYFHNSDRSLQS